MVVVALLGVPPVFVAGVLAVRGWCRRHDLTVLR
jgi:hypothetical protein